MTTESMEKFAQACHDALKASEGEAGRVAVRDLVRKALQDKTFVQENISHATKERDIVYQDPELGFCICVHVYNGAKEGSPHDHGPTWAIYGQAEGETEMTDWEIVTPADGDKPAKVRQTRSYKMVPGDAHVYQPGDIHAPLRRDSTRLLRIEGLNTETVKRTPIEAA